MSKKGLEGGARACLQSPKSGVGVLAFGRQFMDEI
jgi:hypothetical protein